MQTPVRLSSLLLALVVLLSACGGGAVSTPTTAPAAQAPTTAAAPTEAAPTEAVATDATTAPTDAEAAPTTAADAPTTAADAPTSAPAASGDLQIDPSKMSQTLSIYNWADYIDPEVIEQFKSEYNVQVSVDVYDNNEDMIAKIRTGNSGYDIVVPSDYAVDLMAKENLLAKLDKSLLPNIKNLKPENMDLYYDKGNVYSLPYNQGLTGLAYIKSKFSTPPDSWGIVFDPAQAEQLQKDGGFTMLDDEREVPGAALKYMGKSLNDTNAEDLAKVEEALKAQKPFVSAYDSSSVSRKLASGEIIVAHCYSNAALQARIGLSSGDEQYPGNPDIGFFIPKEGATIWQDNLAIVSDSPNQYTAHVFFNFMMRPEVAEKNAEYLLGITPNAEAEKLLPDEIKQLNAEGFAPDAETLKRLEWIERKEGSEAFTNLWTAVKGE